MANLKRRPERELNHDNWDEEEDGEEPGEFKRASEQEMRNRRIIKPKRKLGGEGGSNGDSGDGEGEEPSGNPFSSFSFGLHPTTTTAPSTSSSTFNFQVPGTSSSQVAEGGTGTLFKMAGITPSAEPPTKASADSSTTDNPESAASGSGALMSVPNPSVNEVDVDGEGESDSEGGIVIEESSNSSSLPWNVSARQQRDDSPSVVDSNNVAGSANQSWLDVDDLEDKEASAASSEPVQREGGGRADNNVEQQPHPTTSSGPADSSESESSSNSNHHRPPHFNFGSSFQRFQQNAESSGIGIVRSSLEDDPADYENDTTSSSNKGQFEVDVDVDDEDREAEAEPDPREAEGVDS